MSHQDMKPTNDFFLQQLKDHQLKLTACRKAMIHTLVDLDHPFTADELLHAIETRHSIHRATIYRDVAWFVKAGILKELSFIGIPSTYYEVVSETHHHHFVCEVCHTIVDVNTDEAEACIAQVEGKLTKKGMQVRLHNLKFYGMCSKCK